MIKEKEGESGETAGGSVQPDGSCEGETTEKEGDYTVRQSDEDPPF
jgi:hypothetical protein